MTGPALLGSNEEIVEEPVSVRAESMGAAKLSWTQLQGEVQKDNEGPGVPSFRGLARNKAVSGTKDSGKEDCLSQQENGHK